MVTRFILTTLLLGAALLSSHPASARRIHAAHIGGHQGTVHMHAAGHAGAHPHG